jgi:hypothetical protein
LGIVTWKWRWSVAIHVWVVAAHTRHEGSIWRIVEILGLFAYAVHAMILKAALDAAITWSFIACELLV